MQPRGKNVVASDNMVARPLTPVTALRHGDVPVRLIDFGPGNQVVTADVDMRVRVWCAEVQSGTLDLRSTTARQRSLDRLRSIAFTFDGTGLYLCSGSRLLLAEIATGLELWRYSAPEWWPFLIASPQTVSRLSDGGIVASFDNGTIERFTADHRSVFRVKDSETPNWFSVDEAAGKLVGCDGYHVCVWNLADGKKVQRITLDEHAFAFTYAPQSGLAAVRDAGSLVVRNLFEGTVIDRFALPPGPPLMAFDHQGQTLIYACGNTLVQRDENGDRQIFELPDTARLVSLAVHPSGRIWTGHADGQVFEWNRI